MYRRTFIMFMFESIFDHKFNISECSDVDNGVDVNTFMCIYDHTGQ